MLGHTHNVICIFNCLLCCRLMCHMSNCARWVLIGTSTYMSIKSPCTFLPIAQSCNCQARETSCTQWSLLYCACMRWVSGDWRLWKVSQAGFGCQGWQTCVHMWVKLCGQLYSSRYYVWDTRGQLCTAYTRSYVIFSPSFSPCMGAG